MATIQYGPGVSVTTTGKIEVDLQRCADVLAPAVVGAIVRRTESGKDKDGKAFAGYSAQYKDQLARMGEAAKVDLHLTGGMLASFAKRALTMRPHGFDLLFGPDAGTSPKVRPPLTPDYQARLREAGAKVRERALTAVRAAGKRGPQHNVVGYWLHHGTEHLPPRPWLGLSQDDRKRLMDLLLRTGILRSG